MDNTRQLGHDLETIAWGAVFILWGVTEIFKFLPEGTGVVGMGLILIGLNAARLWKRLPTSGLTLTLGILALILGGLELARPFLHLSFELPVFAILLLVCGVVLLGRTLLQVKHGG
jgi:hypothetical protein